MSELTISINDASWDEEADSIVKSICETRCNGEWQGQDTGLGTRSWTYTFPDIQTCEAVGAYAIKWLSDVGYEDAEWTAEDDE